MMFNNGMFFLTCMLAYASASYAHSIKHLMVFGDSYSTTGSLANGIAPSRANPIGNPGFPGITTSGGVNWVGQAIAKLNSSVVLSNNFAVSGATVDEALVSNESGTGIDDQVALFGQYVAKAGSWKAANTLTAIWVGINDVGLPWQEGKEPPIAAVLQRYLELLNTLYNGGLRRFILFTLPPFDRAPGVIGAPVEAQDVLRSYITNYNNGVRSIAKQFKAAHRDIRGQVQILDTAPAFRKAFANPQKYGAPNATCFDSNGVSCLWHDTFHPGVAIQKLVAEDLVKATKFF
jgi:phospholipase/lecithinase/hemolysin